MEDYYSLTTFYYSKVHFYYFSPFDSTISIIFFITLIYKSMVYSPSSHKNRDNYFRQISWKMIIPSSQLKLSLGRSNKAKSFPVWYSLRSIVVESLLFSTKIKKEILKYIN